MKNNFLKIGGLVVLAGIIIAILMLVKNKNTPAVPLTTPNTISTLSSTPQIISSTPKATNTTSPAAVLVTSTPKPVATPPVSKPIPKPVSTPAPSAPTPVPPTPALAPSPAPAPTANGHTQIAGCAIFPSSNAWNQDVSNLSVHANSETYITSIGRNNKLHPDFGENLEYGIPYNIVPAGQKKVPINFTDYGDESDPGPYPIPDNAKIEGGGDSHVLVLQTGECKLYELFGASKNNQGGWNAASGAMFNLTSNALRPEGWTSTDAAGLPVLPGLVRYDEVASGQITHAIRFTAPRTQNGWIHPATHAAGSNNSSLPPMGLRLRLKASFDTSSYTGQAKVIVEAMKKYGIILADNGSAWYFQGASDSRWKDEELNQLKQVPGSAFEAVNTGSIIKG
jgi:hypothetical protein